MDETMNFVKKYQNEEKMSITYEVFECTLAHNILLNDSENQNIGRALVVEVIGQEWDVLLDINIFDEKNRRKKYGTQLINFLKEKFDRLVTNARNTISRSFLLKNGFVQKKSLFKGRDDVFYYMKNFTNKEEENGNESSGV